MSTYPLPGERVARTLRGVEFGHGYEADAEAPPDVAAVFATLHIHHKVKEMCRTAWERRNDHQSFETYRACLSDWDRKYQDLLDVMRRHRYKSYICQGFRIRLVIEPDGCRVNRLAIEEIDE